MRVARVIEDSVRSVPKRRLSVPKFIFRQK